MKEEIDKLRRRADELEALRAEFPDIREYRLRWRTVLASKRVNASPERCYTSHSCGCCPDAALYLYFYVERSGEQVYADPPFVCVGEKDAYRPFGDRWYEEWQDSVLRTHGPEALELARRLHTVETATDADADDYDYDSDSDTEAEAQP